MEALSTDIDSRLFGSGFKRSAKGIEFIRNLPEATQVFDISFAVNPSYERGAISHVYPRVRLLMPDVSRKASELIAGRQELLAGAPEILVNRPLDHLIPKQEKKQWFAFEEVDFKKIAHEVTFACAEWGLPFFNDYRTVNAIVHGYETRDERPRVQENWFIFVAAAYLILGDRERALEVISTEYGSPGKRKKYSVVFENI